MSTAYVAKLRAKYLFRGCYTHIQYAVVRRRITSNPRILLRFVLVAQTIATSTRMDTQNF